MLDGVSTDKENHLKKTEQVVYKSEKIVKIKFGNFLSRFRISVILIRTGSRLRLISQNNFVELAQQIAEIRVIISKRIVLASVRTALSKNR